MNTTRPNQPQPVFIPQAPSAASVIRDIKDQQITAGSFDPYYFTWADLSDSEKLLALKAWRQDCPDLYEFALTEPDFNPFDEEFDAFDFLMDVIATENFIND